MDSLVTTEWLAGQLGAPDLVVADASYFLPTHGRDAKAEYLAGHIPDAVFLDLATLRDESDPRPNMIPPADVFAMRMQALGIGYADRIVLYDDSPSHTSARAWWMLTAFGTPDVAILDGGLAKWKAEGRPLERGPADPRPRHFTPRHAAQGARTLDQVRAVMDDHSEQIVDARAPARFAGTQPESRAGVEPGHIPGSCNLPYADFFHPDGSWKRDVTLRAAFENAGVEVERPILATCGSGITAAVIVFAAHLLGHKAALYDGSWTEWGADPSTPKARGA